MHPMPISNGTSRHVFYEAIPPSNGKNLEIKPERKSTWSCPMQSLRGGPLASRMFPALAATCGTSRHWCGRESSSGTGLGMAVIPGKDGRGGGGDVLDTRPSPD